MSLAVQATRNASWMFAAALFAKVAGVVGTLLVVRWVSPSAYGEAIAATILVGTAATFSSQWVAQYVLVKTQGRRDLVFHVTVMQAVLGVLALGACFALAHPFARWTNTPGLARFLPWMAVSMLLDRAWMVPERTLMRDMRFRTVALARTTGDLAYTGVSIVTALLGWGGMAVIAGNVARSASKAAILVPAAERRDWLEPCPIRRDAVVDVLRFGLPLAVAIVAGFASSRWDNLLVSSFHGPAVMGAYNIAYNLAGMAAAVVTDQVVDVFVPSFRRLEAARQPEGLVRGATLLALTATPLCVGLAAVAPTVVDAFFSRTWSLVSPMLTLLSLAAIPGPVGSLVFAYLQAIQRSRLLMVLQLASSSLLLGTIALLGRVGPLWACASVGIGSLLSIVISGVALRRATGLPVLRLLGVHVRPLLACVPMWSAVLLVRVAAERAGLVAPALRLALEVACGGLAYVGGALLFARAASTDLIDLAASALARGGRFGRARPTAEASTPHAPT